MNKITTFALKALRKVFHERYNGEYGWVLTRYCDYCDQEGNDHILQRLQEYTGGGFMISKWGTNEYSQAMNVYFSEKGLNLHDMWEIIRGRCVLPYEFSPSLYTNAGVFPLTKEIQDRFGKQVLEDCQLIDILGSYMASEKALSHLWKGAMKVNLDAFYAPWMFKNPWTKWLKGKKVLVVSPFVESIKYQYENNREKLFNEEDTLPQFKELMCIKAVQSQANEKVNFKDWFEALDFMEKEIDKHDYEVAIIGCGAYGMSLAAHVKRQGKVAIHLGGWVQMLFGVYGERWVSQQTQYAKYINKYWIRPNDNERIKKLDTIENGAYW